MNSIDKIMYLINWHRSEDEQHQGIAMAQDVKCIKSFFRPMGPEFGKGVWENCAVIICSRADEELKPYILDMLLWIEDLNWPGAELIQQRLLLFHDTCLLAMHINDIVPALELLQKTGWIFFISELMVNSALKDKISENVLQILGKYALTQDHQL